MPTQAIYEQWLRDRGLPITPQAVQQVANLFQANQAAESDKGSTESRLAATADVDRMLGSFAERTASPPRGSTVGSSRGDVQSTGTQARSPASQPVGGNGGAAPASALPAPAAATAPAGLTPQQIADREVGAAMVHDGMTSMLNYFRGGQQAPSQGNVDATIAATMPEAPAAAPAAPPVDAVASGEEQAARAFDESQAAGVYDRGMQALAPSTGTPIDPNTLTPGELRLLQALGIGVGAAAAGGAVRYARSSPPAVSIGASPPPRGPAPPPMPTGASGPPPVPAAPTPPGQFTMPAGSVPAPPPQAPLTPQSGPSLRSLGPASGGPAAEPPPGVAQSLMQRGPTRQGPGGRMQSPSKVGTVQVPQSAAGGGSRANTPGMPTPINPTGRRSIADDLYGIVWR